MPSNLIWPPIVAGNAQTVRQTCLEVPWTVSFSQTEHICRNPLTMRKLRSLRPIFRAGLQAKVVTKDQFGAWEKKLLGSFPPGKLAEVNLWQGF